ncbi:NADPH-dependent F420 reductase [Variovorax sp. RT4R15]|uniref:NADPH-dependent F420 reductase n=1 Tax=Variovorax sp. RT4R15 TaxID=3443737 RepID=UPI003F482C3F
MHMKIGIIGAGNIGTRLARKLAASGHDVRLANSKGPQAIRDLADEVGATPVTKEKAVTDAEVIILAIPFASLQELANLFENVAPEVVVIDTSNYYPSRDGAIAEVDGGKPESVWSQEQIGRPVVKAWNAVLAATLEAGGKPAGSPGRLAIPVAGDDAKATATARQLVDQTGFDALDTGSLKDSWRQQPGTPAYCTELTIGDLKLAVEAAKNNRASQNRDALMKEFASAGATLTHAQIVARNRSVTT